MASSRSYRGDWVAGRQHGRFVFVFEWCDWWQDVRKRIYQNYPGAIILQLPARSESILALLVLHDPLFNLLQSECSLSASDRWFLWRRGWPGVSVAPHTDLDRLFNFGLYWNETDVQVRSFILCGLLEYHFLGRDCDCRNYCNLPRLWTNLKY